VFARPYLSRRASLTAFSPSKPLVSCAHPIPLQSTDSYGVLPLVVLLDNVDGLFDVAEDYIAMAVVGLHSVSISFSVDRAASNSHVAGP